MSLGRAPSSTRLADCRPRPPPATTHRPTCCSDRHARGAHPRPRTTRKADMAVLDTLPDEKSDKAQHVRTRPRGIARRAQPRRHGGPAGGQRDCQPLPTDFWLRTGCRGRSGVTSHMLCHAVPAADRFPCCTAGLCSVRDRLPPGPSCCPNTWPERPSPTYPRLVGAQRCDICPQRLSAPPALPSFPFCVFLHLVHFPWFAASSHVISAGAFDV